MDLIYEYCLEGFVIKISMNCELIDLLCCLKFLWWYYLISFVCKLCEKLLYIYYYNKERVFEGWNGMLGYKSGWVGSWYKVFFFCRWSSLLKEDILVKLWSFWMVL